MLTRQGFYPLVWFGDNRQAGQHD